MTATHHAKAGPIARITRRLRPAPVPDDGLSEAISASLARMEADAARRDLTAMFAAPAPHAAPEVMDGPVHMVADGYGMMPCCGQHETAVPQADYVTGDPRQVTCRTAAHDTMPDDRAAHHRPYVPDPAAILAADICGLPVLRSTIRARARYWHHGCRCEPGNVTGGVRWLASQYADMGPVAFPWRPAEPAQAVPAQSDDTLTWGRAA